jgi:two-component system OmpR family response regulator
MQDNLPTILLVDDDRTFVPLVGEYLESKGLRVALRHSGDEGLDAFRRGQFDLCVLDVKMPLKDGFRLAEEIRALAPGVPLIFLTGETAKEQRIRGLTIGADDYVTKPFSMEELFLRIMAIWRRVGQQAQRKRQENPVFQVGAYQFNAASRELTLATQTTKLSAIEARLLQLFCESENGIITRETALRKIWGDDDMLRGRSLNVYVSKLRQYLKDDPAIEILNVHGEGYQLVVR